MRELIASWSGEAVITRYDRATGTWLFIALHDTTLGSAMGGARMKVYPTPEDGLRDAMRLAEGMTAKWATIRFPLGGGKSVLALSQPLPPGQREPLFERFGQLIDSLRGAYACGPDLGTTPQDMTVIRRRTRFVHGAGGNGQPPVDPGPFTALGVFVGIRAALRQVFGSDALQGRTVLVEGAGDVGYPLGVLLGESGASVLVSDTDAARAGTLAAATGGRVVPVAEAPRAPCDVYAPCAVGATINERSIAELQCRIVAGSANNQLAEPADAERLHARGILYAPDYVINAGGATALPLLDAKTHTVEQVRARIEGFDAVLEEIFTEARARNVSPQEGARARVERVLASARGS